MKRVIRNCMFETNSSSTHSIIIMPFEKSEKWEKEKVYYFNKRESWDIFGGLPEEQKPKNGNFYTQDEVLEFLKLINFNYNEDDYKEEDDDYYYGELDSVEQFIRECDCGFISYNIWDRDEYLEKDVTTYITDGGEEIVIYCKYGQD